MNEKAIGYTLLGVGIAIIFYAFFSVYTVFTGQAQPVQLFDLPPISLDLNQSFQVEIPQELQQAGVNVAQEQTPKQEIFPADALNTTSNLVAHIVLYGFLVNIGFKIASLGTQMARTIEVNLNKSETPKPQSKQ